MPKRLTKKQKDFVQEFVKSGHATQSALKTYDTEDKKSASVIATNNLKKPHIRQYMEQILDNAGLTDDKIAQKLNSIVNYGTNKKALSEAKVSDAIKTIDLALKLKDRYPAQKQEIQKAEVRLNLQDKTETELLDLVKKQSKELKQFTKLLSSKVNNEDKQEEVKNT